MMLKIFIPILFLSLPAFAQQGKVQSLIQEGIKFHDAGKYQEAILKYQEALALDPHSGMIHYELGFSYHALKEYKLALKHVNLALEKKDGELELHALTLKGSIVDDGGNTKGAIKVYEGALKKYPENYLLHFNYGVSLERMGKHDQAERALIGALQLNASHPGSHLQLANIQARKGLRVKNLMGLYYFLMLENGTERAKEAWGKLQAQFYKGVSVEGTRPNTINVVVNSDGGGDEFQSLEFMLPLLLAASLEENKDVPQLEKFALDTEKFFSVLGEVKEEKKKKEGEKNFWRTFYKDFFKTLNSNGHTEAFVYHIAMASGMEEV